MRNRPPTPRFNTALAVRVGARYEIRVTLMRAYGCCLAMHAWAVVDDFGNLVPVEYIA